MARETKQDRIVRSMIDQVTEHLHQFRTLTSNPSTKESDLERWCESVLRNCLGFTATNGYSIRVQESRGKLRPDLIITKSDKPVLVVEVKKLDFDLNKSDFRSGKVQLSEYLHSIGSVHWGMLCNGYEWRLFDFSDSAVGGVEVISFDLRNEADEIDSTKRGLEDTCWNLIDIHEATFASGAWSEYSREATAFSPDSLAKAILSVDTVKYIARVIRGEHDYRANVEVLIEKLADLLAKGLDDSVPGWNEARQAELNKYVTSQKRANRRKKSSGSKEAKDLHPGQIVLSDVKVAVTIGEAKPDQGSSGTAA